MTLGALLSRLKKVRRCSGGWTAECPAHDDRRNSLSITQAAAKILVFCHAGCPTERVLSSVNLTTADLFDHLQRSSSTKSNGALTTYDYRNATGELLYQVTRGKNKRFSQRRPAGQGGWKHTLGGVRRVPYRLPELLASAPNELVFIVEGEKDADNLARLGLVATTNSGGAGKWPKDDQYAEPFRDRHVVILPDNDEPGLNHATTVAKAVHPVAASVKMIHLDGLPQKGDVSDWLDVGHTVEELIELVDFAACWQPEEHLVTDRDTEDTGRDALARLRELNAEASMGDISAALQEMGAALQNNNKLTKVVAREEAISLLKGRVSSPAKLVDAAMSAEVETVSTPASGGFILCDPDRWPDPVEGVAFLDEISCTLKRFVRGGSAVYDSVTLWTVLAHVYDCFDCLPILLITSATKRSGKSTLLAVLSALVPRPLSASNLTTAVLFRAMERFKPTLLIDEADTFLTDNRELAGVINSGHTRQGARVLRVEGDTHELAAFSSWGPKAIAMIGKPTDTILDRSIQIRMERKGIRDATEHLRLDRLSELEPLRSRAARWAIDNNESLKTADPEIPNTLTNSRQRDNWRSLLAIADAVGGEWPKRAREAATQAAGFDEGGSYSEALLSDMQCLFEEHGDFIESAKAADYLASQEDKPWPEWGKNGKPITPHALARLLKPFGIKPNHRREDDKTLRGYSRRDFEDAFERYVPRSEPAVSAERPVTKVAQPAHDLGSEGYKDSRVAQRNETVPFQTTAKPLREKGRAGCATLDSGEEGSDWLFTVAPKTDESEIEEGII